ncbi:MAG: hypothetical protein KH366_21330 [Clostridiaceae bacterium]|nr:hypothetical protein [Clostridiaceae bacterium]
MIDKNKMPVAIGVAFVWFTTQFGGGFASGNQLRQYFVSFGVWAFLTCIMAQFIGAFYQWYALKYARKHEVYDYRSFNNSFYGKYAPIFSNLYELVYIVTLCVAPAAAFATGVSTMESAFGINHWIGTIFVGAFIFIVAVYGTNVVRKVASTLSVLIVVGLFIVYVPNIIAQWGDITANISASAANPAPAGKAIWTGVVYAAFQLASIGLLVQHSKPFSSPDDAKTSMVYGFFVNAIICLMAVLGLMAITNDPNFATESIPLLILVNKGVAPSLLRPIISILIVLGSVSTAVNMIAGMSNRVCSSIDKSFDPTAKPGMNVVIVTLVCTLVAFGIAQLGLNKIVAVGYKYLGYLTIPVIMIPYIVHMVTTKFDTKDAK